MFFSLTTPQLVFCFLTLRSPLFSSLPPCLLYFVIHSFIHSHSPSTKALTHSLLFRSLSNTHSCTLSLPVTYPTYSVVPTSPLSLSLCHLLILALSYSYKHSSTHFFNSLLHFIHHSFLLSFVPSFSFIRSSNIIFSPSCLPSFPPLFLLHFLSLSSFQHYLPIFPFLPFLFSLLLFFLSVFFLSPSSLSSLFYVLFIIILCFSICYFFTS